jgi:4-oxalocrotonate tautomerase
MREHEEKNMPFVQVNLWSGITLENKKKIVQGITKVFTDIGIPAEAATIILIEEPKENWATGGKLHSEKDPDYLH